MPITKAVKNIEFSEKDQKQIDYTNELLELKNEKVKALQKIEIETQQSIKQLKEDNARIGIENDRLGKEYINNKKEYDRQAEVLARLKKEVADTQILLGNSKKELKDTNELLEQNTELAKKEQDRLNNLIIKQSDQRNVLSKEINEFEEKKQKWDERKGQVIEFLKILN